MRDLVGTIILLCALTQPPVVGEGSPSPRKFFAFCVGDGGGISPGTLAEEAALLRERSVGRLRSHFCVENAHAPVATRRMQ